MASVKFPTPLHPLITRDILVETYEVRIWFCLVLITGRSHRRFRLERRCGFVGKTGRRLGVMEGLSSMCEGLGP